jgi:hypothetical protein
MPRWARSTFRFRRTETNLRGEFGSLHMEFFSQVDLADRRRRGRIIPT